MRAASNTRLDRSHRKALERLVDSEPSSTSAHAMHLNQLSTPFLAFLDTAAGSRFLALLEISRIPMEQTGVKLAPSDDYNAGW